MKSDYIKNGTRTGCKGFNIDNLVIKDMYINQNLTMKEIGAKLNISHWTVLYRLNKIGVRKTVRHFIDHNKFDIITPDTAYWAGFIAADGCINNKNIDIEIQKSDYKHLIKLCDLVGRDDKLWYRDRIKDGKVYKYVCLSIRSQPIINKLYDFYKITPQKSLTLNHPQNLPHNCLNHFVRGYIDGDGSIGWHKYNKKPRLNIASGSLQFLKWIESSIKCNVDTFNPPIHKRKDNDLYTIEFMGTQVYNILDWLYNDSIDETRLNRKYKKYLSFK